MDVSINRHLVLCNCSHPNRWAYECVALLAIHIRKKYRSFSLSLPPTSIVAVEIGCDLSGLEFSLRILETNDYFIYKLTGWYEFLIFQTISIKFSRLDPFSFELVFRVMTNLSVAVVVVIVVVIGDVITHNDDVFVSSGIVAHFGRKWIIYGQVVCNTQYPSFVATNDEIGIEYR